MGEGIVREFGMDVYTVLYLKWITNGGLLCSTGTLLSGMWQPRGEGSLGENGYMYITSQSFLCSPKTITTLLTGYTPI